MSSLWELMFCAKNTWRFGTTNEPTRIKWTRISTLAFNFLWLPSNALVSATAKRTEKLQYHVDVMKFHSAGFLYSYDNISVRKHHWRPPRYNIFSWSEVICPITLVAPDSFCYAGDLQQVWQRILQLQFRTRFLCPISFACVWPSLSHASAVPQGTVRAMSAAYERSLKSALRRHQTP